MALKTALAFLVIFLIVHGEEEGFRREAETEKGTERDERERERGRDKEERQIGVRLLKELKKMRKEVQSLREEVQDLRKEVQDFRKEQGKINSELRQSMWEGKKLGVATIFGICMAVVTILGLDKRFRRWVKKKCVKRAEKIRDFCNAKREENVGEEIEVRTEEGEGAGEGGGEV